MEHIFVKNGEISLSVNYEGHGVPILFLHGFPETKETWDALLPILKKTLGENVKKYLFVTMDLRGYGKSDKPKGVEKYKLEVLATDVAAVLLNFLQKGQKAVLIGHDWGGMIGWKCAEYYPELTSALVTINAPYPDYFPKAFFSRQQFFKSWYIYFFQIPFLPEIISRLFGKYITNFLLTKDLGKTPEAKAAIERSERTRTCSIRPPLSYYRAWMGSFFKKTKKSEALKKINIPTLVFAGAKDHYVSAHLTCPPTDHAPKTRSLVLNAHHWIHFEMPRKTSEEIVSFLSSHLL